MNDLPGLQAHLEPPSTRLSGGNYDAPKCESYLPAGTKAAPRDLLTDLSRLDERLRIAATSLPNADVLSNEIASDLERARHLLEIIRTEAEAMPDLSGDDECGFEGRVDAEFQRLGGGAYTVFWTCPRCGTEHAEEREAGDDQ